MTTKTKAQEYLPSHWHVGVHRNNNIWFFLPQQPVQAASLFTLLLLIRWLSISVHVWGREEHKIQGLFAASCFDTQLIRCNTGVELHGWSSLSPERTCFPSGEKKLLPLHITNSSQDTTSSFLTFFFSRWHENILNAFTYVNSLYNDQNWPKKYHILVKAV